MLNGAMISITKVYLPNNLLTVLTAIGLMNTILTVSGLTSQKVLAIILKGVMIPGGVITMLTGSHC